MTNLIESILIAIHMFPFFAICFTLPIILTTIFHYKKINFMRISLNYMMIFYVLSVFCLTFFPLPLAKQLSSLQHHSIQFVPFRFVCDILRESPLVINNPNTYLSAITNRAVLQVVFNVFMIIPFGMILRYYYGFNSKKVLLFSFLLSLFIEIGQLTGLFFIYPGSYRLCDVDDLLANTMGGYLGFKIISLFENYIPNIHSFDLVLTSFLPLRKSQLALHHNLHH
jgi:glycopeptide antibiotics resistance protein